MCTHFKIFLLTVVLLCLASGILSAAALTQDQPTTGSEAYLLLLDEHDYESAWQSMSPLFKLLHDQPLWQRRQQALREAYGFTISRTLRRVSYRQTYSKSPDGTYIIVQFDTTFTNKANAVETVVLTCEEWQNCSVRDSIIN